MCQAVPCFPTGIFLYTCGIFLHCGEKTTALFTPASPFFFTGHVFTGPPGIPPGYFPHADGISFGSGFKKATMKNLSAFCPGLMLILLSSSCNNGASDSVKEAKDSNAAKIDSQRTIEQPLSAKGLSKGDADFLVNAASGSMMEVELGQLAQTNSRTRQVKDFGAMMVRDHSEGGLKLKTLASAKNVILPDAVSNRQQKEIDDLKKKKGKEFDKAYVLLMIDDHKDDIREFEKQAGKGMDSLTRAFASSSLEMLRRHLDSANSLQNLLGINYIKGDPIPK